LLAHPPTQFGWIFLSKAFLHKSGSSVLLQDVCVELLGLLNPEAAVIMVADLLLRNAV
jgi:hypothetical protein